MSGFLNGLAGAAPGSATPLGTGTPGCSGTLALNAPLDPKIGEAGFELLCSNAPANTLGLGLIANVGDPLGSDPLGLGVKFHIDVFNSTELYSADFLSDGSGEGRAALPIPNNPFIVGHSYTAQAFWVEAGEVVRAVAVPADLVEGSHPGAPPALMPAAGRHRARWIPRIASATRAITPSPIPI